jgi:hypothetical protein
MLLLDDSDDDSVLPEVVPHKPQTLRVLENSDDDNNDKATGTGTGTGTGRAPYKHQSQVMQIMANLSPDSPPPCAGMEEEDDDGSTACIEETGEQEEDHDDGNVKAARVRAGQARPLVLDLSSDEEEF